MASSRADVIASERGLAAVAGIQAAYDQVAWEIHDPLPKLRHIILHLNKALGDLAGVAERLDHAATAGGSTTPDVISRELLGVEARIADLITLAAQLANLRELDLGAVWAARLAENLSKRAPEAELTEVLLGAAGRDG